MSDIFRHRRNQPQSAVRLDCTNRMAKSLVCVVMPEQVIPGPLSQVGTCKITNGISGKAFGFGATYGGGTNGYIAVGKVPTIGFGPSGKKCRSIFFRVRYNGAGGGGFGRMLDHTESSRAESFFVGSGGILQYIFYHGGLAANVQTGISQNAIQTGERTLGMSVNIETGDIVGYVDGRRSLAVNNGFSNASMYYPAGDMVIGNRPSDVARSFDGLIHYGLIFDDMLSDQDHAALTDNSWRLFSRRRYSIGASVIAQYARPTADAMTGTWVSSLGGSLAAAIDEAIADDADYIGTTYGSVCEVALGSLADPGVSSGHKVRYRIAADAGGIVVRLRQGATTIASWTHNPAPASLSTFEQTLSGAEADSITDYTALKLQFEAY